MTDALRSWPIGLRRLAEVIGPKAALDLAEALGGTEDNYIPKTARIDHPITAVIGLDRMEALCGALGGERLDIPRGAHKDLKKARILGAAGSCKAVALATGCTQRYVRHVRNAVGDPRQLGLFDPADD